MTGQLSTSVEIYCYGNVINMINWLNSNSKVSAEEMAEYTLNSLPLTLRPYFFGE